MKILVFDNYDSFTYNLVHYIEQCGNFHVDVFKNDEIDIKKIAEYDKIILSPGPGLPNESGILLELIKKYAPEKDIFGVCLGLQAIVEAFGGKLQNLEKVFHGVATPIHVKNQSGIFKNLPEKFKVGRYHSWVADTESLPDCFEITAVDEQNQIMAIKHKQYKVEAVQFHPESILTENGLEMIKNWIEE